jgi:hypothetical protein
MILFHQKGSKVGVTMNEVMERVWTKGRGSVKGGVPKV